MGKLGVVLRREFLERVRSKWFVIGTLLGPLFFLVVAFGPQLMSGKDAATNDLAHIVVLDATGVAMGDRMGAALRETYPLSPAPSVRVIDPASIAAAEDSATLQVQRSEALGYLVLDSNTVAGRSVRYSGRNASSMNEVQLIRNVVRQTLLAERLERAGIDAARVSELTKTRLEMRTQKIGDKGREKGSGMGALLFGYGVALLLYMMIVIYGQTIMRGVMEEKTTRVAEVVVSSVSTDTLLAGKVIGVGMVAVTQVLSWVALTFALLAALGPRLPGKFDLSSLPEITLWSGFALLCFFVLGFVLYSSLFAAVGSMVNSQEDVQQASLPVMLLLVSSAVFMGPVIANPGGPLARSLSLIPFSAPILMPLRMTLIPVPWYELVASIAGVAIASLAAIWVSARIYRVGLLMYGKRPSFKELARWIRYSG